MSVVLSYSKLQLKYKALEKELDRYKSGDEFVRFNKKYDKLTKRAIKAESDNIKLKAENKKLNVKNKNLLFDCKVQKNNYEELNYKVLNRDKKIKYLRNLIKNNIVVEKKLSEANSTIDEQANIIKELNLKLEKTEAQKQKLTAQVNRDYTNSSLPSSHKIGRKKICNSRVQSGKQPGAQIGHKGYTRKTYSEANEVIKVPRPAMYSDESIFKETGKIIKKQVVDIIVGSYIREYQFMEYLNIQTGKIVHAPIPKALHNEAVYGENVKALAVMLNSDANVSIDKTIEIINEISNQDIKLSKGFVNNLNEKVAIASEAELDEIFIKLQQFKYMHIDATNVRVNGKNVNIFVTSNPDNVMFYYRENKGKKGVKGTAAEDYTQVLIHDHDITFYNYGSEHQECLAHIIRYLQSSIENEEDLKWHKEMKLLLQEMISSIKKETLDNSTKLDFIKRYDSILELSILEYEKNPPTKYYREGFNLAKRLKKFKTSTLYFLEDEEIPYTNNLAERNIRSIKRKSNTVGSFRSSESLEKYCGVKSIMENVKIIGGSIFEHLKKTLSLEISFDEVSN